ncbi:MAG: hypothetical protein QG584_2551, partial [Pseudomonadota bacterium]|nr:hypothetical protein [Pseudomonadota bacterium]
CYRHLAACAAPVARVAVMDILYSAIAIAIVFVILGRVFDDRNQ